MKKYKSTCLQFNKPTKSIGRIYSKECFDNALEDPVVQEQLKNNCLFGWLAPGNSDVGDLSKISHIVTNIDTDEQEATATIETLDTPEGRILETLLDYGAPIALSVQGVGDVNENNEVENYELQSINVVVEGEDKSCY